ncbi:hypothetical protein ACJX0J_028779 [Zea mays]
MSLHETRGLHLMGVIFKEKFMVSLKKSTQILLEEVGVLHYSMMFELEELGATSNLHLSMDIKIFIDIFLLFFLFFTFPLMFFMSDWGTSWQLPLLKRFMIQPFHEGGNITSKILKLLHLCQIKILNPGGLERNTKRKTIIVHASIMYLEVHYTVYS